VIRPLHIIASPDRSHPRADTPSASAILDALTDISELIRRAASPTATTAEVITALRLVLAAADNCGISADARLGLVGENVHEDGLPDYAAAVRIPIAA